MYIAGFPRSGSTILGNVLGAYSGVCHIGELRDLWYRFFDGPSGNCGCGEELGACPFWQSVTQRVLRRHPDIRSNRALRRFLRHPGWRGVGSDGLVEQCVDICRSTYGAIAAEAEVSTIVDSSKDTSLAWVTLRTGFGRFLLVHLVRDVRGCLLSRQRRALVKSRRDRATLSGRVALPDAIRWSAANWGALLCGASGRGSYAHVSYETFVTQPRETAEDLLKRAGHLVEDAGPFIGSHSVRLPVIHSVWGNHRVRFRSGEVDIRLDEWWRERLRPHEKVLARTAAWPGIVATQAAAFLGRSRENTSNAAWSRRPG